MLILHTKAFSEANLVLHQRLIHQKLLILFLYKITMNQKDVSRVQKIPGIACMEGTMFIKIADSTSFFKKNPEQNQRISHYSSQINHVVLNTLTMFVEKNTLRN